MTFRCSSTWRQGTTSESRGARDGSTTSYARSAWRSNGREARRAQRLRPLRDAPAGIFRDPLAWQQAKRRGAEPRSTSLSRSRSRSAESTKGVGLRARSYRSVWQLLVEGVGKLPEYAHLITPMVRGMLWG